MISRLLLLVFLLCPLLLKGQQVLVDSISRALEVMTEPEEKTDLMLGLCRAKLFLGGPKLGRAAIKQTIDYTLAQKDSVSYGKALCYQSQSFSNNAEYGLEVSLRAYGIGRRHQDMDLMLFGIYHIAEYYIYEKNDFTSGSKWLKLGQSLNHEKITHKHLGNFYKVAAVNCQFSGKRDSAEYWYGQALEEFRAVGNDPDIVPGLNRTSAQDWDRGDQNAAQILIYLSRCYVQDRDFRGGDSLLQAAEEDLTRWGAFDMLAWVQEEIGNNRQTEGRLAEAIEAFEKALRIYESFSSTKYLSSTNRQIGTLFMALRDPTVAIEYFERGYPHAEQNTDTLEMVTIRTLQGQSYGDLRQFAIAREHFEEAISMAQALGDSLSTAYVLGTVGGIEIAANNLEAAKSAYLRAYSIHQAYQDEPSLISEATALSDIYLQLGQLDSTHAYLGIAEELMKDVGGISARPSLAELLARVAEASGDYPAALAHQRRYQAYQDSFFSKRSQESLRSAQVRQNVIDYQSKTEAAERESSLLAQRNQLYLALAASLFFLLLIGAFLFSKLRIARQQLASQNQELSDLNITKDRFFGIIAHDLRNPIVALQSADMQIEHHANRNDINSVKKIAELVGDTTRHLNRLLDNLLSWALSQQGVLPYQPEQINVAEVVDEVIEIFLPAASVKRIVLTADIKAETIVFADLPAFHAILRNLVGNAIKFTPTGGNIKLSASSSDDKARIMVIDDGIGMSESKLSSIFQVAAGSSFGTAGEKGTGLGLTLVKELTTLNRGTVTVSSSSGAGTSFTVELPRKV